MVPVDVCVHLLHDDDRVWDPTYSGICLPCWNRLMDQCLPQLLETLGAAQQSEPLNETQVEHSPLAMIYAHFRIPLHKFTANLASYSSPSNFCTCIVLPAGNTAVSTQRYFRRTVSLSTRSWRNVPNEKHTVEPLQGTKLCLSINTVTVRLCP